LLAGERIEKAFEAMIGWKKIFGASYARIVRPPTQEELQNRGRTSDVI
jgi:hypothetical protein